MGVFAGFGQGASIDVDPHDSGQHACGVDLGLKGSADVRLYGLSVSIGPRDGNSAALSLPSTGPPWMSINALDPTSAGNPTISVGAGGYIGAGGIYSFY